METKEKAFDALVYLSSILASNLDMSRLKEMIVRNLDMSDLPIDHEELASHVDISDIAGNLDLYDLANYHIDMDDLASHIEADCEKVAEHVDMDELTTYLGHEGKEKVADLEERFSALCSDVEGMTKNGGSNALPFEQLALEHERIQKTVDAMSNALSIRVEELVEAKSQILGLQDLTCDLNHQLDRMQKRSFTGRMQQLRRWIKKTCRL
ncbi:MAG: hypothetical protein Unbinned767contig1000_5 [Prokaryotic dsDNA virus sp.]|nr:MAG: hypothetical protein Unbinned767contig1000_5 [Prokaryotic dsDNA virus sp.]|tara:strand:+ start:1418 stop:2047 length:630 start_codon:yes stop_codon:yes gene_type:complete